jgi:hypothetical protein
VKDICTIEVPSSTEWAFQELHPVFRPNVFVDITDSLATKIEALAHYDMGMRKFPHRVRRKHCARLPRGGETRPACRRQKRLSWSGRCGRREIIDDEVY